MGEAHPSFKVAHTISFLASSHTHSVAQWATAGIQLGSGPRPGPAAAASVSRLCPGPSFSLTPSPPLPGLPSLLPVPHTQLSSMSAVSSCQPALSFTQSHLFRGGHPQHSALHPQRSCWPLTQCLGAFAAAAVAGSPGQLNKAAWHQLAGQPMMEGLLSGPLHILSVICVICVHGPGPVCYPLVTGRHRYPRNPAQATLPHLPHAHRWLWGLQVASTPGTWWRPFWVTMDW